MTIRHLRIFVTVCQCGSITEAARQMYVAQPSVSLAIGELERHSRKLRITEAGKKLYDYAASLVSLYGEMEERMADQNIGGSLYVGSSITIGNRLLTGVVKRFREKNPLVAVRARVDNSDNIERLTAEGELDMGLIEGVAHQPQLRPEVFLDDELALLCGKGHPLWKKGETAPEELPRYVFIAREKGSGTRELFDSALLTRELVVKPEWESISTHAILEAVSENLGIAALPYRLAEPYLESGRLRRVRIAGMDLKRKFYVITHKSKYRTAEAQKFIDEVRKAGTYIPPIPAYGAAGQGTAAE